MKRMDFNALLKLSAVQWNTGALLRLPLLPPQGYFLLASLLASLQKAIAETQLQ